MNFNTITTLRKLNKRLFLLSIFFIRNIDEVINETIEKFVWEDKYGKNNMSRTNFLLYYISPIMQANIKCTIHCK